MDVASRARAVDRLLLALVALDISIAAVAFFFPEAWFALFHGSDYVDPQGLLPRAGADWAAFALFQAIAYFRWRARPYWLAVIAGIRLSDIFTDWAYLYFCRDVTWFGRIGLFSASPINLLAGCFLLKSYRILTR